MISLPNEVKTALDILSQNGYTAHIVGGCVRDGIIGVHPNDWDITTSSIPEQTIEAFKNFKVFKTGIKHGTVTVIINGMNLEVTTYRMDGKYTDNRRPDNVQFTADIKEDLKRRDFTINAIAYNEKEGIIDLFGGLNDIKNKVIRCVGDADTRFNEDALRILRAMRFAATLNFSISDETEKSIIKNRELLKNIACERIAEELNKLIIGDNAAYVLNKFREVIAVFMPQIKPSFDFDQRNPHHNLDVWSHTVKSISTAPKDKIIRLALLFHDLGKPSCLKLDEKGIGHFKKHPIASEQICKEVLTELKYDTYTKTEVSTLVLYHDATIKCDRINIRKWLRKLGAETFSKLLELQKADNGAKTQPNSKRYNDAVKAQKELEKIILKGLCYSLKELNISGSDLIKIGITEGQTIGRVLEKLLTLVIEEKCENKKEALIKRAKQLT